MQFKQNIDIKLFNEYKFKINMQLNSDGSLIFHAILFSLVIVFILITSLTSFRD